MSQNVSVNVAAFVSDIMVVSSCINKGLSCSLPAGMFLYTFFLYALVYVSTYVYAQV